MCGGTKSSSPAAAQLLVCCRLLGTAKGELRPDGGLVDVGSCTVELADSKEAGDDSSTVASKLAFSGLLLRLLLEATSGLGDRVDSVGLLLSCAANKPERRDVGALTSSLTISKLALRLRPALGDCIDWANSALDTD